MNPILNKKIRIPCSQGKIKQAMRLSESELILNEDGSIYHLNLRPDQIANTIITVGDQDRVKSVSKHFDRIDVEVQKREFFTQTGELNGQRISVISTGIGTDNIDIVLNELDALVNIDFDRREIKENKTSLDIIRIGTSGAIPEGIEMDSLLVSEFAIGIDALLRFYKQENSDKEIYLRDAFESHFATDLQSYCYQYDESLAERLGDKLIKGITLTAPGFYAPQGRSIRLKSYDDNFFKRLSAFNLHGKRITNIEMETAGIYGMSRLLGHRAISCNALLANRTTGEFSKQPKKTVERLIKLVLESIF